MQVHFRLIPQTHLTLSGGKITSEVVSKIAGASYPMHMGTVTGPLPCVCALSDLQTRALPRSKRSSCGTWPTTTTDRWLGQHSPQVECRARPLTPCACLHVSGHPQGPPQQPAPPQPPTQHKRRPCEADKSFRMPFWQVVDSEWGNVAIQDLNCIREAIVASRAGTPPLLETLCDEGFEW